MFATPVFHRSDHDFAQKVDRCIPVAAAGVGLRGSARPKRAIASWAVPAETLHRGTPEGPQAAAHLVGCPLVFVDLCGVVHVFVYYCAIHRNGPKGVFLTYFDRVEINFIFSCSVIMKTVSR